MLMTLVLGLALFVTLFIVIVPAVQRGGWPEVLGVLALIALYAVADRWFRRAGRRR
jgi:hypothetical protein